MNINNIPKNFWLSKVWKNYKHKKKQQQDNNNPFKCWILTLQLYSTVRGLPAVQLLNISYQHTAIVLAWSKQFSQNWKTKKLLDKTVPQNIGNYNSLPFF